jgi:allantoin racemase
MRIRVQVVSSQENVPEFLVALQKQCESAADVDTEIDLRGTPHGALGDQYQSLLHFDTDVIVRQAYNEVRESDYDAYAMANSLDPGVGALREILDIPVLSVMEVGCSIATMLGEKFGVVVANDKFIPMYSSMIAGYGLGGRVAGIASTSFDHIPDIDRVFSDDSIAEKTIHEFERVVAQIADEGAEVVLPAGPVGCLLADRGIHDIDGVRVLDLYSSLVKFAEAMAYLGHECGVTTSRRRKYRKPPESLLREADRRYGIIDT